MTDFRRPCPDAGEFANGAAMAIALRGLEQVAGDRGSDSQMDTEMVHDGGGNLVWIGETMELLEKLQQRQQAQAGRGPASILISERDLVFRWREMEREILRVNRRG